MSEMTGVLACRGVVAPEVMGGRSEDIRVEQRHTKLGGTRGTEYRYGTYAEEWYDATQQRDAARNMIISCSTKTIRDIVGTVARRQTRLTVRACGAHR